MKSNSEIQPFVIFSIKRPPKIDSRSKEEKLVLLEYLISKLNAENQYTEKEINAFIKQYHDDFCTIRREFIVQGFMDREDNMYRINGREMWTKWEGNIIGTFFLGHF